MSNVELVIEDEPPPGSAPARALSGRPADAPDKRVRRRAPDKISIYRGPLERHYGHDPAVLGSRSGGSSCTRSHTISGSATSACASSTATGVNAAVVPRITLLGVIAAVHRDDDLVFRKTNRGGAATSPTTERSSRRDRESAHLAEPHLRLTVLYRKEVSPMNRRIARAAQIGALVLVFTLVPAALAAKGGHHAAASSASCTVSGNARLRERPADRPGDQLHGHRRVRYLGLCPRLHA